MSVPSDGNAVRDAVPEFEHRTPGRNGGPFGFACIYRAGRHLVGIVLSSLLLAAGQPAWAAGLPPTLTKAFGAASILIGQSTSLTFSIANPNVGTALTSINFADGLPSGLKVATPNGLSNTCGGSIGAATGSTTVSMSGVTLAPGASCTWSVDVTATSAGAKNNTTTAIGATESGSGSTASASINVPVPSAPTLAKAFGAASIPVGQSTSLTFSIANPNPTFTTLTSINFADGLPSGLKVATPNGLSNTCGGSIGAATGSTTVSMSGVTLAPGASCTWSVDVTATSAGAKNNTTTAIGATESGSGSTASASINVPVPSAPTLAKAFGAASIPVGQSTSLTFSIANPNPTFTTLTSINFADGLPSGLKVATPNGLSNTCGGSIGAATGSTTVSMSGVTLAPGASCTWSVDVTATSAGAKNNTTTAIGATESGSGSTASASINVPVPSAPTLAKAFGAASIPVGQSTSLTFSIANPNPTFTTLTSINFADGLPSGLKVATPNGLSNTCGGSIGAATGSTTVSMSGVTLAPGASCTWSVDVTATSAGAKNNTTTAIGATESGSGSTASASINVPVPSAPTLAKAFGAASIPVGQSTSLTFSIANPNPTFTTLTSINFADGLPSGLKVATPNGLSNTCGGSIGAATGSTTVSMSGVTLAPGASCTWSVDVTATSAGAKNNTTNAIGATESGSGSTASASIDVLGTPVLTGAASRRTHGAAGPFDLVLSLVPTNPSTEPRVGPAQTIVFTFDKPLNAATVTFTEGVATAAGPTFSGNDVIVNLTGVTDVQYVTVGLTNVGSTDGGTGGSGSVRVGFLEGDVNGTRSVSVSDLVLVNRQQLVPLTAANYLMDVSVSGSVTVSDKVIVNRDLLHVLPTP